MKPVDFFYKFDKGRGHSSNPCSPKKRKIKKKKIFLMAKTLGFSMPWMDSSKSIFWSRLQNDRSCHSVIKLRHTTWVVWGARFQSWLNGCNDELRLYVWWQLLLRFEYTDFGFVSLHLIIYNSVFKVQVYFKIKMETQILHKKSLQTLFIGFKYETAVILLIILVLQAILVS